MGIQKQLTISVDDGHPLDLKLADILTKNHLRATFYVPIKKIGGKVIAKGEIRRLAEMFEIGAHTYNHVDLTKVSKEAAWGELINGKKALEDILGKRIKSFAFPFGHYDKELVKMAKKVGYESCRSGRIVNFTPFNDRDFLQHPNFHIYPHKLLTELKHSLKYGDFLTMYRRILLINKNHMELVGYFDKKHPLHFWCHSLDIEEFNLWDFFGSL